MSGRAGDDAPGSVARSLTVGQAAAADRLDTAYTAAAGGRFRAVLLDGVPGIGKTTVLARFLHDHREADPVHVAGLAWEADRPGALVQRVASALGVPLDAAGTALDWGTALAADWRARSGGTPVVVAVDDTHASDVASLQALSSAAVRAQDAAVLLVLVTRNAGPAAHDGDLRQALDALPADRVTVPPLDPTQVRLLVARRTGVDLPAAVARRLRDHTAGVPRHLVEIMRDSPPRRWSDWQRRLPVPTSVQQEVAAALAGCSAATRALVEAAAVLGGGAPLADVVDLAAVVTPVDDPIAALDEAFRAGLLGTPVGNGLDTVTFPRRFVRGAVYAGLGPARRHALHERAAAVVTDPARRLRHRVEAAPLPDDALAGELLALAERKAEEGAWAVAADALIDASRISTDRADREDRLLRAVDALAGAGLVSRAVDALADVEALPPGARRDGVLAYVAVQRGRRAEATALLDSAWASRGADRDTTATICQRRVLHSLADWDGEELVRWAGRAIEHADPGAPAAVETRAIIGLGEAARGRIEDASTAYRRAVRESPGGPQHHRARMGLGWLLLAQDEPEAARRELEYAVSGGRQGGSHRIQLWAHIWLARTRFALGDWSGALQEVDQAQLVLAETDLDLLRPLVHWTGAQVHALRGEPDAAAHQLELGSAAEHDYTVMTVPALLARAHVAEAGSDYESVIHHLAPLAHRTPRGGLDEPGFWPWHDLYANALVVTDRLTEADEFLTPLDAVVRRRGHRSAAARLGYVRGRLLAARGDIDAADAAFRAARAHVDDLPLPYEKARVDFAHGVTLRRAGRRRDAAAVLSEARQRFAALGAKVYVERSDRELKTGRHGARLGTTDLDQLTEQERTVATLVARGLSNKEVAADMLLSVKTVQFHLTRTYAKLGVRSRAELAAHYPRTTG